MRKIDHPNGGVPWFQVKSVKINENYNFKFSSNDIAIVTIQSRDSIKNFGDYKIPAAKLEKENSHPSSNKIFIKG